MAYRRARGDMIEVYKIVKEIYDSKTTCNILKYRDKIHIMGHNYILEHKRSYNPTREKFSQIELSITGILYQNIL